MTTAELLKQAAPVYRAALKVQGPVYMYAIQAGDDGPIKLGITRDPAQRLKTLQTGNAETLRGLAAWPILLAEERQIHDEFAYARLRGEWFRPVPELVEMVLALGGYFCDWDPA